MEPCISTLGDLSGITIIFPCCARTDSVSARRGLLNPSSRTPTPAIESSCNFKACSIQRFRAANPRSPPPLFWSIVRAGNLHDGLFGVGCGLIAERTARIFVRASAYVRMRTKNGRSEAVPPNCQNTLNPWIAFRVLPATSCRQPKP